MFSNRVANSASFLQMPAESQLLFFHMILRADDDGIVESYPLMKLLGTTPDSFRVLLAKNFIKQLNEDQVIVISDWLEHNNLRSDRKVNSMYLPLLLEKYPETEIVAVKPRSDVKDNSKRLDSPRTAEVRLGKVRLINSGEIGISQVIEVPEEKQEKVMKDTAYLKVFELWGDYPIGWRKNRTEIDAAKNLLADTTLEEMAKVIKLYQKYRSSPFCPAIYKPSDLDRKWENLIDFSKKRNG